MENYICEYYDVKSGSKEKERITAEGPAKAFEKFIENRGKEKWSIPEIFMKSKVRIINQETKTDYRIDTHGEVKQSRISMH